MTLVEAALPPKQAVYLDSPLISTFRQILPFYISGIFGAVETPLFLMLRPAIQLQIALTGVPKNLDVRKVKIAQVAKLPVALNGVIFYPYNSKSNIDVVANRSVRHVLTLHGESNKLASVRPAARLYDYICIAGPLGRDRYLDAGIFSKADVDDGRLVMMGDSFVQSIPWIRRSASVNSGALLYAPTWEGYGAGMNNYSSVSGQRGFHIAVEAARTAKTSRIVVKPHPYLGCLQPSILKDFIGGVRMLKKLGFEVKLALADASLPVRLLCNTLLPSIPLQQESVSVPLDVGLGICDVSGMEAVFLKQNIPHLVISKASEIPKKLHEIYSKKAIIRNGCTNLVTQNYLADFEEIDEGHRRQVFGWQEASVESMTGSEQREWLVNYVGSDPFWRRARGA